MENTDTTKTKKCCDCKIEKPLSDFYPCKSCKDGLMRRCKLCFGIYRIRLKARNQSDIAGIKKTKKCNKCGNVLPLTDFYTRKKGDKIIFFSPCKKCNAVTQKRHYHAAEGGKILSEIDSIKQIDGILRELSENQFIIDKEKSKEQQIVENLQRETDDAIANLQIQNKYFTRLLKRFFKKIHNRNFRKDYIYGSVNLTKGKLFLTLKPDLANAMKDKP
jgi:hypothetical protein